MRYLLRSVPLIVVWCLAATNVQAQSDTQPPQLVDLSISPTTVDVTAGVQTITATVHVTDDLSGIDTSSGQRVRVQLFSPSGQTVAGSNRSQSGITLDGTFPINITVPRFSQPGLWTVVVYLRDNIGNSVT